ncbi:MAG: putative antitoxin of bacterial toxin-antitoxin system, YdaS/YdaT [Pseudomonadota bacterium]
MRKPEVKTQEFFLVLDSAAEKCGGQNALARRLEVRNGTMSEYRSGKRSVPDEVIRQIAEISGEKPEDLWLMAQDARNPFRQEPVTEGRIYRIPIFRRSRRTP